MLESVDTKIVRGSFPNDDSEFVVQYSKPTGVRTRKAIIVCGVGSATQYMLHSNSAANVRRALMERLYHVEVNGQLRRPPQPTPGIYATLSELGVGIAKHVGIRSPVARSDFVASRPAEKKRVYELAHESLKLLPVSVQDSRVEGAFVKCEKVNAKKGDPAPRIIQPRSVRYNIEVGRYLAPVEHSIYEAIDELWGGKTVMKGYNAAEIGEIISTKWDMFDEPVALGLDASRFDQHVSVDALKFEHGVYNLIFDSPELSRLLKWQLLNRGVAHADDAVFFYRKVGSRMSGDMNTALGNIIIMCLMVLRYVQERGVKAQLINNGDDCTLFFERRDIPRMVEGLHEWFLQYGFNIVEEPLAYELEHIEFCQMHPVCVDGQWVMVRNMANSLTKDAISIRSRNLDDLQGWMHCVGMCGLAMASGVPVQQEYYKFFVRSGRKGKRLHHVEGRSGLTWFSAGMTARERPVADSTRVSFWKAFGIDPAMQLNIETHFMQQILPQNATQAEAYYNYLDI